MKHRNTFFPSRTSLLVYSSSNSLFLTQPLFYSPPFPPGKTTTLRISPGMDPPTLFALASTITFPFARSSPHNDPLQHNLHERTSPIEIFFFGHTPYLTGPTGRCFEIPYAPCTFGPPPDRFTTPPMPPTTYAFQPAPLDLSLGSIKKISFGLLSFTVLLQLVRGLTLNPTEWKESVSRLLLCTFLVFVQYTLSLLNSSFFVLPFCFFLGNLKNGPLSLLPSPPPMSDCDSSMRACGWQYGLVWFGFRQSGSTDCSVHFSSVL